MKWHLENRKQLHEKHCGRKEKSILLSNSGHMTHKSIQGMKAPQSRQHHLLWSWFLTLMLLMSVFFFILEQLLWCMLLEHVRSTCPCFTGLLQYSHEKGEKGGSLSFKFNLVDPEGNKLIDQSFFISVLGRHPPQPPLPPPPPPPILLPAALPLRLKWFFSLRREEGNYCRFIPLSCVLADALHLGHILTVNHTVTFCSNHSCCVVIEIQPILCAQSWIRGGCSQHQQLPTYAQREAKLHINSTEMTTETYKLIILV